MCDFGTPYFVLNRTKKEPVNEIQCHSLSSSPRRPVNLENLEMENSQGRYNRRAVSFIVALSHSGFPLGLENLEKWEGIFQSGKSQGILIRLEKSGKSQGKSHKILEKSGNFRQILFIIFSDI